MFRLTAALIFCGVCLALLLTGPGATGQDKDTPAPKFKGKLPKDWSKLGLSEEQKQSIYKVQADLEPKIEALRAQIKKLQKDEKEQLLNVLTEDQKAKLRQLAAPDKKAPADKKTTDKEK